MKLKYKLLVTLVTFLGSLGYIAFVQPPKVSAGSLSYNIVCRDGSTRLDITENNSRHEVTVKCRSGAKFTYEQGGNLRGSCPDPQVPGTEVDNANGANNRMIFYCLQSPGRPDHPAPRSNTTPTVRGSGGQNTNNPNPEEPTTFEGDCREAEVKDLDSRNCAVVGIIKTITNTLAGLAGVIIVAMIIWGGIQYSMAGPDAAKVQAAKQKIASALVALLLLIFGFSLIQWLVPGGLL